MHERGCVMEQTIKRIEDEFDDPELDEIERQVQEAVEQEKKNITAASLVRHKSFLSPAEILNCLNSNEDGDANLFIQLHRNRFCYDHSIGKWFKWHGHYWKEDIIGEVVTGIDAVIDEYMKEASRQAAEKLKAVRNGKKNDEDVAKELEKRLISRIHDLQTLYRKRQILTLVSQGTDSLGISGDEWDRDPWLVACENGVIDIRTGDFRAGIPSDFVKTVAATSWKGLNEPAPLWERFLREILDGKPDYVDYLQRLFGYGITGLTTDHTIPFLWGHHGRNGKGTMLETLKFVLGPFAGPIPSEMLLSDKRARSSAGPSPDIMSLRGRRIAWASETGEGRKLAVDKVKQLTGADTIVGRPPHGKRMIEFSPTHKLFLLTNHKPAIPPTDYAMWARVHLIPFELSFVDEPQKSFERKRDPSLPEKLKQEASGILAWLVRGCLEWQKQGLNPPPSIKQATAEYQQDEDILGLFVSECIATDSEAEVRAAVLYAAYRRWCDAFGYKPLGGKKFGERMKEFFEKKADSSGNYYVGIYLTAFAEDDTRVSGYVE